MQAEDASGDLEAIEAEIFAARTKACVVCDWIESRPSEEQEVWDRNLAKGVKFAGHRAIWAAMARRGFSNSVKVIESHRAARHRVAS